VVVSALANSLAIYTYSLGYGEDRINQASALGAAMALAGLLTKLVARGRLLRLAGAVCCFLVLFSMMKAATLQATDWARVRQWEIQLGDDFKKYLQRHPEDADQGIVVVHGFPRYVSSFDFDPEFIWLAYAYPRLHGVPGAYYHVPVEDVETLRRPWKEKIKRHFSRGYRFWPMLIAPIHPTAESLGTTRPISLVQVDREFGIGCAAHRIVLPLNQRPEIAPISVDQMLFGEWREDAGTSFRRISVGECESIAARVNGG
jgi:hypothetical protein